MQQVRKRFGVIRRMLSAHPSEMLSPKEQISLGRYGSIKKVRIVQTLAATLAARTPLLSPDDPAAAASPHSAQVDAGLQELRRLSDASAAQVMQKLQRIDTRQVLPQLDKTMSEHSILSVGSTGSTASAASIVAGTPSAIASR